MAATMELSTALMSSAQRTTNTNPASMRAGIIPVDRQPQYSPRQAYNNNYTLSDTTTTSHTTNIHTITTNTTLRQENVALIVIHIFAKY